MENRFSRSVFAEPQRDLWKASVARFERPASAVFSSERRKNSGWSSNNNNAWDSVLKAVLRNRASEDGVDWAAATAYLDPASDDHLQDDDDGGGSESNADPRRAFRGKQDKEVPRDKHSYAYLHRHLKDLPPKSRLSDADRGRLDAALRPAFPERPALQWPACADGVAGASDSLELYVLYLDYEVERKPPPGEPSGPVVRMVCKTRDGTAVMLRAHSKRPYWYFRPRGKLLQLLNHDEPHALLWIKDRLNALAREKSAPGRKPEDAVLEVRAERDLRSVYCYEPDASACVRVTMREPGLVPCVRDAVASKQFAWVGEDPAALPYERFEADIPYVLRFMIDGDVSGCGWVRVPRAALKQTQGERRSRCQLELSVDAAAVVGAPEIEAVPPLRFLDLDIECAAPKGKFPTPERDPVICVSACVYDISTGKDTPVREVCLALGTVAEIEEQTRKKRSKDPRTQKWAEKELRWAAPAVVTFGGHPRRGGRPFRVFPEHDKPDEFDTDAEARMLLAFRALLAEYADCDFIGGYNSDGFDLDYLIRRGDALGIGWQLRDWSRVRQYPCDNPSKEFNSKAFGKRVTKELKCPGRMTFDTMRLVLRDADPGMKLSSYTLDSVAQKVLAGEKKASVSHEKITPLWLGLDATAETRKRVLYYNLRDAQLSWYIAETRAYFWTNAALARITGVPFDFLTKNGQGVRTTSMLARDLRKERYLIPTFTDEEKRALCHEYEGATVLEPRRGWYSAFMTTSDFAALYPSIMLAHNLGYRSSVPDRYVDALAGEKLGKPVLRPGAPPWLLEFATKHQLDVTPKGAVFIKEAVIPAETTRVLRRLLAERAKVRAELKYEEDDQRASVLDGRQNAIKISANSTYGYTGNQVGQMPRVQISEGVTSFGRRYIMMCKRGIERDMPWPEEFFEYLRTKVDPVHGTTFERDCRSGLYRPIVIAGDTDSVMVAWPGVYHVEAAHLLGQYSSDWCTNVLFHARGLKDLKLTFEKVMGNPLFTAPKRYAYAFYKPGAAAPDYLSAKGLEIVRRDNSQMARSVMKDVFQALIMEGDPLKAFRAAESVVDDLAAGRINVHNLVITKSLSREPSECMPAARDETYAKLLKKERESSLSAESQRKRPAQGKAALQQKKKKQAKTALLPPPPPSMSLAAFCDKQRVARDQRHEIESVAREMGIDTGREALLVAESRAKAELGKYLKYAKQVHVRLALRMLARDPNSAPHCNDRIPYVIVRREPGAKIGECGEDPIFAIAHRIPINYDYYLEKQLRKPLKRIFKHLDRDCMRVLIDRAGVRPRERATDLRQFFQVQPETASACEEAKNEEESDAEDAVAAFDVGSLARAAADMEEAACTMPDSVVKLKDLETHEPSERTYRWLCQERDKKLAPLRHELCSREATRKRSFSASGSAAGPLAEFLARGGACEACRAPSDEVLCPRCRAEPTLLDPRLSRAQQERDDAAARSANIWSECRRCVGSDAEALLCENRGCENLLYRLQLKTEAEHKQSRFDKYARCKARPRVEIEYEPMDVDVPMGV